MALANLRPKGLWCFAPEARVGRVGNTLYIGELLVRNLKLMAFAAAACALAPGALRAQTGKGFGEWQGVTANASACYYPGSMGYNCFYTNPYHEAFSITSATRPLFYLPKAGVFGNGGSFGPTLDIFCVDYFDESNGGTYAVNYTNLGVDGGLVGWGGGV